MKSDKSSVNSGLSSVRAVVLVAVLSTICAAATYAAIPALLASLGVVSASPANSNIAVSAAQQVPRTINHQGVIRVGMGEDKDLFNGIGFFKFAIVDPDGGPNGIIRWSNDGSAEGSSAVPKSAVQLTVERGVYSVLLGDPSIENMPPIPAHLFADDNLVLRIWFNDGVNLEERIGDHRLSTSPYAFRSADVPAGTIVAFGGANKPDGWLWCDGTAYHRAEYPGLFAAIATAWGAPDGASFNVPDFRGRFLRGVNGTAEATTDDRDPDAADRVASNLGGNEGNLVGTLQFDATARPRTDLTIPSSSGSHTHTEPLYQVFSNNPNTCSDNISLGCGSSAGVSESITGGSHSHVIQGGDQETRPVNVYVHFIIKY